MTQTNQHHVAEENDRISLCSEGLRSMRLCPIELKRLLEDVYDSPRQNRSHCELDEASKLPGHFAADRAFLIGNPNTTASEISKSGYH